MSREFRCSRCNSPLDVTPDTIVIVCRYCGQLNWIRKDLKFDVYITPTKSIEDARRILKHRIGGRRISRELLLYLPFYLVDVTCDVDYEGDFIVTVVKEKVRRRDGETIIETETRYIPVHVKGRLEGERSKIPVVARKGVGGSMIRHLGSHLIGSDIEPIEIKDFELDRKTSKSILGAELDSKEAIDIAIDEHLDNLRTYVKRLMEDEARAEASVYGTPTIVNTQRLRITPLNIEANTSPLTYYPIYVFNYGGRGEYKAYVTGWDLYPILLEEPMPIWSRLAWILGGILGSTALSTIFLFIASRIESVFQLLGAGVLFLIPAGYISFYSVKKALRPVRVESG